MLHFSFRPGDIQAVKVLITSFYTQTPLTLERIEINQNIQNIPSPPNPPTLFKNNLCLKSQDFTVTEPNSAAEALIAGSVGLVPQDLYFQIYDCIEWECEVLRPAIYSGNFEKDSDFLLQKLRDFLNGREYMAGSDNVSLADIVIFSDLFSLITPEKFNIGTELKNWIERLKLNYAFQKGIEQVSGTDGNTQIFLDVLTADIAEKKKQKCIFPVSGERNILVTSALPYVNNVPHLGNIIGCVLSADCYARFCRARGYNTIYICGTDEYGTATETKAYEEGCSCQEICDKYHAIHKSIYDWFEISCDHFGRTPTRHQTKIAQGIFLKLKERDKIVQNELQQLFSVALGKFLADRLVIGICPKCQYEDARGDQCDNCGSLLNMTDLINPKCKLTNTTPVLRTTKHFFLDLPNISDELKVYIEQTSQIGGWSSNCLQITNAWLRDGLKQRCITRDLKWGIPVPLEGFEDKVFYVWFDAPIGYISITADYTKDWELWWKNPKEVELVQFMGKDNVPFHTVIFPATLIGTGENWTMMKSISVTEYLNYETGKFSKSRNTGVFGDDVKKTKIPVEIWRYYLLSNRPEQQDTSFVWENLADRNNNELLKNLGNFVNRALKFLDKNFERKVPEVKAEGLEEIKALGLELQAKVIEYIDKFEKIQIKAALSCAMEISAIGNKFLQSYQPWHLVKEGKIDMCKTVVAAAVGMTRLLAVVFEPFIPSTSRSILNQLALPWEEGISMRDNILESVLNISTFVPAGHIINEPKLLFQPIDQEDINKYRKEFSGTEGVSVKAK